MFIGYLIVPGTILGAENTIVKKNYLFLYSFQCSVWRFKKVKWERSAFNNILG